VNPVKSHKRSTGLGDPAFAPHMADGDSMVLTKTNEEASGVLERQSTWKTVCIHDADFHAPVIGKIMSRDTSAG